ncbi:hypothetical protein Asppvi_010867 [Aspergillus pseudoviridinutans]|uniref:Transcription factor domain-containing protein n=1 Tax=Aspergillus pseudoviridinutans TaxID=1517512 RepID=A0A9P3BII0_9EURO|nr:uncharacterized protein Asppvi_010867 [Aspergillus pseudoviridinutans]GIJ91892.1 hypothetical protein Asppvi_010867 [Aspergillus pseudoviridinutans]
MITDERPDLLEQMNGMNGYDAADDNDSALPSFPDYDLDWSDVMANIDSFAVPDQIGADNTAPTRSVLAGQIYQERIIYAVKTLKSWPGLYAERGHIPFIHAHLYAQCLPSNDRNGRLVARCVSQAARRLVNEHHKLDTLSPIEQLASVQVLCLYQIIQLFDGDVSLRSEAEAARPLLDQWIRQLKHRAKPVDSALKDVVSATSTHDPWWGWVFDECVRRTLIVGFTIEGLYSFLKDGWDASHHDFTDLSFYAQRALWDAPSGYFWRTALRDRLLLPVRFPSWDADTTNAQPTDLEELGMIMLVFIKGLDYCREWAGKEALGRFGLLLPDLGS